MIRDSVSGRQNHRKGDWIWHIIIFPFSPSQKTENNLSKKYLRKFLSSILVQQIKKILENPFCCCGQCRALESKRLRTSVIMGYFNGSWPLSLVSIQKLPLKKNLWETLTGVKSVTTSPGLPCISLSSAVWQQVWIGKSNIRDFEQRISGDDGISCPRDLFILSTTLLRLSFCMLFLSFGNRCDYLQLMDVCKGHQGLVCKHPCAMDV